MLFRSCLNSSQVGGCPWYNWSSMCLWYQSQALLFIVIPTNSMALASEQGNLLTIFSISSKNSYGSSPSSPLNSRVFNLRKSWIDTPSSGTVPLAILRGAVAGGGGGEVTEIWAFPRAISSFSAWFQARSASNSFRSFEFSPVDCWDSSL